MKTLILKKIASHYGSPWTAEDKDYVVLDAGQVIGRIMLHPQAPPGNPRFWTITRSNRNGRSRLCDNARTSDAGF